MLNLSILIPVYNAENFIGRCLESLKHQNLNANEYEILILNDGSTDNSTSVIENYMDDFKNIHVFTEPNCGSDISRNKLLAKAKGKFIYLLDADDYLIHNALPQILSFGLKKDLDIVAFQSELTDESDVFKSDLHSFNFNKIPILTGGEFVKKFPIFRQEVWWYIISKDFLDRHDIRFNEKKGQSNGDFVFTNECFVQAEEIAFIEISIHRYFQSEESVMRSKDPNKIERLNQNLFNAILDFDQLCEKLRISNANLSPFVHKYLERRKGTMINFFIHGLLIKRVNEKVIRNYIELLKIKKMYPALIDLGRDSNGLKHRMIEAIIKNEKFLFFYHRIFIK